MDDASGRLKTSASPAFVTTGNKRASTTTYPKNGQDQNVQVNQGPWHMPPRGNAETFTAPKTGQRQSL